MFICIIFCMVMTTSTNSYSFCSTCIHFTQSDSVSSRQPNCNLFKTHPLFVDRQDVDFIGKEICGDKGKYFISGVNMTVYEQNTKLFPTLKYKKGRTRP